MHPFCSAFSVTSTCGELVEMSAARCGHSMVSHDQKVVVFGGYDGKKYLNDVAKFDPSAGKWTSFPISGAAPSGRYCHGSTLDGDNLYIIGGGNVDDKLDDLWVLDLKQKKWNKLEPTNSSAPAPEPRQGLVATVYDNKLYIFGGFSKESHSAFNEVWFFDLENKSWNFVEPEGTVPNARHGHVGVRVDDTWIIHGGRKDHGEKYSIDVYGFHLSSQEWRRFGVVQHAASPWGCPAVRFGHSATLDPVSESIIITGGYTHTDGVTFCPTNSALRLDLIPTIHSLSSVAARLSPLEDKIQQLA
eukprot:GHVU01126404.1.p1 GENE.GHVU01126404.1~~GHVU01126404.1.p1  ORF type:complete len:302 (-),score=41.30 GHVU01126404.1:1339-2244(-)